MRPRRPPRRKRSLILAAVTALAVTWPGAAWADDAWDDDEGPLDDRAFDYTTAAKRNYARGFLEVLGVLGIGYAQYQLDKSNSIDWDLGYDWQSFRAKLLFEDGETVEMTPGDHVLIPAHWKHRVEWTTPDEPTVWLAVFY